MRMTQHRHLAARALVGRRVVLVARIRALVAVGGAALGDAAGRAASVSAARAAARLCRRARERRLATHALRLRRDRRRVLRGHRGRLGGGGGDSGDGGGLLGLGDGEQRRVDRARVVACRHGERGALRALQPERGAQLKGGDVEVLALQHAKPPAKLARREVAQRRLGLGEGAHAARGGGLRFERVIGARRLERRRGKVVRLDTRARDAAGRGAARAGAGIAARGREVAQAILQRRPHVRGGGDAEAARAATCRERRGDDRKDVGRRRGAHRATKGGAARDVA